MRPRRLRANSRTSNVQHNSEQKAFDWRCSATATAKRIFSKLLTLKTPPRLATPLFKTALCAIASRWPIYKHWPENSQRHDAAVAATNVESPGNSQTRNRVPGLRIYAGM